MFLRLYAKSFVFKKETKSISLQSGLENLNRGTIFGCKVSLRLVILIMKSFNPNKILLKQEGSGINRSHSLIKSMHYDLENPLILKNPV
ncbi:hypothetical protein ACFOG5_17935 [Pedobacter fastidiosus]|uniref:hypothetical protein n=1 Tax=Pedobacter fastidiosus TaxID=2765361 RepID=UPI00360D84ED